MNTEKILNRCDHTELKQIADFESIKSFIDDAVKYNTASVCIPPCYVKEATEYAQGKTKICTVIGFPNGYNTTAVKVFETAEAVSNGADEIDMVINIGWLKAGLYEKVLEEIREIKKACNGKLLKVIIETCLLNDDEKVRMCDIVSQSGADYIKTSTGFAGGGATREDIILMKKNVAPHLNIKAAGGISSLEDAEDFLNLGADRLGTSRVVKIVKAVSEA